MKNKWAWDPSGPNWAWDQARSHLAQGTWPGPTWAQLGPGDPLGLVPLGAGIRLTRPHLGLQARLYNFENKMGRRLSSPAIYTTKLCDFSARIKWE